MITNQVHFYLILESLPGASVHMTRKQTNNAYFNGELVNELLERGITDTTFISTSNTREDVFKKIDSMRRNELYPHSERDCTDDCKRRGNLTKSFI